MDLLHADWAIEWLKRPQECPCCEGEGCHIRQMPIDDMMLLKVEACSTCHGNGYGVWFSRN